MNKIVLSLIKRAQDNDIRLELEGSSLILKSENENIDDNLLADIKINKELIIQYFEKIEANKNYNELGNNTIRYYDRDSFIHIPLSFSQERLWFLDQLQGSTEYHIPTVLRLEGSLDVSVLEQTLQEIVSRHEVLRTLLLSEEGVGYQEVISGSGWLLESEDISSEELLEGSLVDYLGRPFDLSLDYKLRACLYRLGSDQYVLACVFHHIASDGWSEGILVNEFMELYNSFKSGRSAVLADLPLQYADYSIWQREYLQGSFLEDQLLYWEEKLRGVSTLSLPTDYVRPSVQSNSGSSISFTLSEGLRDSLVSLCRDQGVTLFMLLLSAFKVLLSRYSDQDDICVGTPIANRTQSELEGMIGFFVNTLALRSNLSGDLSFRDLLSDVKQTTLESYDHQLVPFEKVVERVITSRDMSSSPLFQVLFSLQNNEEGKDLDLDGITISNYEFETVTAQFDLTLSAAESHQGISLSMNYCTALFDSSTIERMLVHYHELLNSIVQDIDQPLGSLKILSKTEQEQLLHAFNDTYVSYPQDKTVVDLFEQQVERTPDAVAVVYQGEELSYRELDNKSNQLAHYLRDQGVVPDALVGICLERSLEMLIGIMGILKSGGAYVPVDPSYPKDRIDYILEDGGIGLVLSSSSSSKVVNERTGLSVLSLDSDWDIISGFSSEKPVDVLSADNLAYVMYTSGTTGNPKGVTITHGNIINLCKNCDYIVLNSDTVWLPTGSISFDATTIEFFGTLLNGGQLVLVNTDTLLSTDKLKQLIADNGVNTLWMTASWFHQIAENDISVFECLRYLLVGGDIVMFNYTNKLIEIYPDLHIINGYGPTENTTFSAVYNIDKITHSSIPIGKPIANTQIYILDSALELVPIGVVGELCISGEGLARGYLNNAELTSEKFVSNPFIAGERIYRTGDLARWLPDGNLEFMGRRDDQVKIRGYRIELGEIESVLSGLSYIRQAVVLAQDDLSSGKRLVGYVVCEGDFDKELVQADLRVLLPEYMVPMLWVSLDAMPLTSNGKIDKKALPEPDGSGFSSREYVAPRNKTEEQLVLIWQELLDIEPIGIHDNFFELGGHSLLATRLVSIIRKELEIELSIREVFTHSSIGGLSSHLSVRLEKGLLPAVSLQARASHIPLSFSQERLWFLDQLQGSTEYHIPTVLRLEGSLDVSVLEQTLQEIVSRHEVLRTLIVSEQGIGYQQVISSSAWSLDRTDISEELLQDSLYAYLGRPFDLSLDYKLRACLYRLGSDQYVLACVFHHIASDGWSEGILVNEFMELYNSFKSGRSAVLADLPLQYADYSIWQREYLQGSFLEDQLLYWEEKLRGVSTLSLPTDYVRPSVQSNSGSSISFTLNEGLRDSLVSLCRDQGVTLFMLLLSAFKVLLSRYSDQDDICVGTPIANRTQSELEGMIGFFVNTLALRSNLSGDLSFRDLLSDVKQTTLESYDHQLVPFEKVVERVITSRDMSSSPLFQVLFSLQNNEEGKDLDLDGITISNYEFETVTAQFDLTLSAAESHQGISLSMNYCTALFDSSTIERMLVHYHELLNSIVQDIDQPLGSLKILSKTEQEQLLHAFNDTYVSYPQDKTVVDLFEQQVERTPDAIAVVYQGEELSYRELDNKSNQLAHYLRDQGVGPDALVGICLERSLEMLIGIMGILKSGGAYVPVDPSYPKDRIDYILEDGGIGLVLSSSSSSKVVNERTGLSVLSLDSDWDIISGFSSEKPVDVLSADNLAYVMYTSGSTGRPKGVMIAHKNVTNLINSQVNTFNIDSDDVILQFSNFVFDASVEQFFIALSTGSRLVLINRVRIFDTIKLLDFIDDQKITHIHATPSMLSTLPVRKTFKYLKRVVVIGEICNEKLAKNWGDIYMFYNEYGPTETTVTSTIYAYNNIIENKDVPIGKPIANTQIYILDSALELVPIGVVGELCISGDGLARGYLNNAELTSEKFVSNPFIAGERIYRTGDLARWLPDGNLEFMGRRDDQVKIRGYRIELGEIESSLSGLSYIRQAVVLAQDDLSSGKRLVGYVVCEGDFDKELVQADLRVLLPEYMVPMLWVSLDSMPLTSNGKIDKKSLPEPDGSGFSSREYVAPRNKTEEQLVLIWQELLDIEPIGIHDNFFELGGHSLLATRLVSMIRKELEIELSIREVFTHSSIGGLSSHLSVRLEKGLLPAVSLQARASHIPLSFSQERLWFLDQLQGSTEYHIPTVLRLEGSLDVSVLEQTLQEIVSRHEVLRTLIVSEQGIGYQQVISSSAWSLDRTDISEELLQDSLYAYLGRPFDLSLDYKLRACLYRLGSDQYVLACVFHHIASDGWSEGILVNEFMELYNSFKSGRSAVLADLPLQYADYSIWQREYLQGSFLEDQLLYWEEKLRGVSTLSLPTDYVRPSVQSNSGSSISFTLSEGLRDSLVSLCRDQGVTLFMLLLSAFKVLLSRYSGQDDICVGTPIANRTQSELEGMIGFFVNTLALRSNLSGDLSFRDLLSDVKQTTLESYDHQLVPFEKVVERVITSRDMSSSPLFQVLFSLQNNEEGKDLDLDGITISNYEFETVTAQFDLTLSAAESHQGISLSMNYCTALFDSSTIERMLVHYHELLNSIVQDIDQPLGSLKILSKTEEHQLLHVFNDTYVSYPQDKTVVDLFEQQVERTPDAIAVVYQGEELSYRELDNKSNQLADYLRDQGVGPDALVGICLERSLEMLIGIMGILKSGGAYVPVDPSYPKDRIDYILEDGGIGLVLSSSSSSKVVNERTGLSVLSLDSDWDIISGFSSEKPVDVLSADNLAYVIYTSGSTGRPKGVMNAHRGIVNRLLWTQSHYQLTGEDIILQKTSFSFDVSVWELLWPVICGSKLIFAKPEGHKDAGYLKTFIEHNNITTIHFVSSMLKIFLEEIDLGDCGSLQRVLCSGEALQADQISLFKNKFRGVRLDNLYGPTEAAIDVSSWEVPLGDSFSRVLIGKPVSNTSLYVLDSALQLVPIGVAGELCIGGVQVARGYLNNPELTSEKFVSNPFIAGERIYRTGDLARWLPDGNLEFMGRRDDQVKIRGYRIELGEIESALSGLSYIRQAVVLAQDDLSSGKRLVGYVVCEGDFDKELVQADLRVLLPEYMVPMLWVSLDSMPLTSNGKIDKKSLPEPDGSGFSSREYVAPRNKTEEQLVLIWQDLLGIDPIGIHDNFFELGGHSLQVVQLISRLQRLDYHIGVKDIFVSPTIASISDKLSSMLSFYNVPANGITTGNESITPSMVPLIDFSQEDLDTIIGMAPGGVSNIEDIYPLSPLQEGIHFHHLMSDPNQGDPYVLSMLLSFSVAEKRSAFIDALQFVVNRHDVLRTCFLSTGLPYAVQVVLREAVLSVDNLEMDSSENILEQLELLIAPGSHWIDISKAPLLELKSADDPEGESYYLIVHYHHLMMDHVGIEKIIEEVSLCLSGESSNLPVPFLYREFIGHTLHMQSTDNSESYFRTLMGSIEEPTYPFNLSNVLGDGKGIEESIVVLSKDLSIRLRNVCAHLSISPAVLFHAAFGLVVARCSNQGYALFGSLFSGRLQGSLGAADSLGLFINTLPVALELKGNVKEYLKEVRVRLEELLSYEQTPLSRIHNWSGISNDMALFSALLNYRHSLSSEEDKDDLDLDMTVIAGHERTNYPFSLDVDDFGIDFGLTAQVDRSIGASRILAYMEQSLVELMDGVDNLEEINVNSLNILPEEEEHQLLHVFNDTYVSYPQDKTVVDLFEQQVERTPDAIAVVYQGEALSYRELDNKSNQLAHYLRGEGVEPDSLVGICLERSLEMLIGIMGILKSGAAYVPIDPGYPKERISYIIVDSNIKVLLTDETTVESIESKNDIKLILLDKDWKNIAKEKSKKTADLVKSNNLAYVIYTSGSTGNPKGVMIKHSSLKDYIITFLDFFKVKKSDSILSQSTISFDASIEEIFPILSIGGKLVIADNNFETILSLCEKYGITILSTNPFMIEFINSKSEINLFSLEKIISGGDVLKPSYINNIYDKVSVYNSYGPTEATVCVSYHNIINLSNTIAIGKPIANTQIYILDSALELVPIGVVGELCISGEGLARGYLNNAELTSEKFVSNPFIAGERIYRTGDLARWLPDGNLEFMGRRDDQVKIRGYRIELGEIESSLSGLSYIRQAVVLAQDDLSSGKRLVGYVVCEGDFDKELVQADLRVLLPEYMVPMLWVSLDSMPLTSNGKIDKKSLPEPDGSGFSSREYVAPRNKTEEQLVLIWQELLDIEPIGIHDNFFELGGHSLLATRLVSMIRKELEIELSIREVFIHSSIGGLSSHLSVRLEKGLLPAVSLQARASHIPLSFSQERLWFLDQLQGSTEYHIPTVLRLEGSLDVSVLEQILQEIVSRHEVLRTLIVSEQGIGYQQVISSSAWSLDRTDISEELLQDSLYAYLGRPFDLSLDYKLRACLYRLGSDQYVLACVFHHIASDGWSEGILVNEFMELYNSFKSGRSAVLADLPLQYADYSIWQREYLQGSFLEDQLLYWEEKLRGVSTLSLPTDYVRPSVQSNSGSSISFTLNEGLRDSLVSLCRDQGVTLFMLLLSAFKVLLSRYSDQDDICVGTPIANRTQSELEGMIGFFVNTLALRSNLSGDLSFRDLLSDVKQTTLESYDHQLVPFEKVVERVITSRDMSSSPLFQVLFSLQNNEEGKDLDLDGITISNYEFETVTAQFDLTLSAAESHQGISLSMNYCTALFDSSTIERMLVHYHELLNSIVQDIDQPLGSLKILSKTEEHQLLHVFNDTYVSYPQDKTVVDLFEQQVERTPDAIAVVYQGEELSYRELDNKSNQLAHYLKSIGIVSDSRVGILFNRSCDMLISMLAILKSGSAYVPLDPSLPSKRLLYIIKDSNISFIVYREKLLLSKLPVSDFISLINISESSNDKSLRMVNNRRQDSIVYIMYTSGTTGKAKGIAICDKNVISLINNPLSKISIDSSDKVLQWSNYAFDGSTYEIFGTLLSGACLYLIDTLTASDAEALSHVINSNKLSVVFITTALFNSLTEYNLSLLSSLRLLLFGGEKVSLPPVRKILSALGPDKILHVYGPTETTVYATCYPINSIPQNIETIPIGYPLCNTQIYILDSALELVPIGVVGELCISGEGLARGYLNNPELTSEKFVSNPFIAGERIYRTGDLARWLPDGNLEFMGRRDDQVKIRGYRIELGEIESSLSGLSYIRQAVVLAQDDLSSGKRLVGYVVCEGDFDKELVQADLRVLLPEYMVPMLWVSLDAMPLTSNGKIDKKALPEPDGSGFSSREYVAARNKTEEQLVLIWQELLDIEPIGIHDNFFELGGHSLLATRLVSMIRKELEIELSIREVFTHSSIGGLSSHLSVRLEKGLLPAVSLQARASHIPLSFSQERLWFLDQLQGSTEYHIPTVLRLEGSLDVSVLEQTLQEIVSRHEVLRTLIVSEQGIGYQQVISSSAWSLDRTDISEELLQDSLYAYLGRPFDLSLDYKLRACLYRLGSDQYVLACVFHHIASDGWSEGILVNEFMELYNSFKSGRSAVLADLPLQYADYSIWQREYLQGSFLEDQLLYWEEKLRGVSTLSLPTDYVRPSVQSNSGSSISFTLSEGLRDSLVSLCRDQGVTLFMLLLSAFKVLLSRYSGQDDICVGTPIANRTQSELEGMIGFFVNTLALRSNLSGDLSFRDLLSDVKQTTLESYDHQLVPFEKVVERVITSRDMSSSPLFQVLFSLQNNEEGKDLDLDGITISNYEFETVTAQFDLTLSAAESHQGISLSMNYCTALFDSSTIERMLVHYHELLNSIVQDIDQPLGSLKILSKTEQEQLLHAFNDTYVSYPQDKTVVDLFEQQVERTPDAVAVVYEGEELSYRELDNKSNQLAHYLRQNYNLKSGDIVGLMLDRSIWSIISILGILKSGTAYLPIDKDYPDERKLFLVNDADIKLLIIDSESLFEVIDYNVPVFSIDIEFETVLKEDLTALKKSEIISSNLAYVIYTSGSTGRPKGVMISHGSLINYLLYSIDRYGSDDGCYSFPLFSSLSFDLTQTSIYLTLLTGGQLHVYASNDVSTVLKAIALNDDITSIKLTPAHLSLFDDIEMFKLKRFIIGGEQLTYSDLNNLGELDSSVRLFNEYGPTEATIGCSVEDVTDYNSLNRISIGKPIANTQIYILDSALQLVPIGVAGELCIGGVQVARGYLNNAELTSEKFVSNPFIAGERIYRTGDLARWLPDGNLEFIGRGDDQVKIRGYRIELGEIESALIELSYIRQAVVLAQDDLSGDKRLVGYVVSQSDFDKELVQDELRLRLPDYMVPMLWVSLDAMPLTSNGKIDKKSLPEPDGSGFSSSEYVAPRNKTEEQLVLIWQELLDIEPIGIHDNFFELGGHSLLATRLVSMIRKELSVELSIQEIFEHITIGELASIIEIFEQDFDNAEEDKDNYNVNIEI